MSLPTGYTIKSYSDPRYRNRASAKPARKSIIYSRPVYDPTTGDRWPSMQVAARELRLNANTLRTALKDRAPVMVAGKCRYLRWEPKR